MRDFDPSAYGEADRREVDPPIQVEMATWSPEGQLDWWVRSGACLVPLWGLLMVIENC
jgi:hypothetical protein